MNPRYEDEAKRRQVAKDKARERGHEVLSPLGAKKLFGKSAEAIRKAVRNRHVEVGFDHCITDKRVALILLNSAIDYWGQPDDSVVDKMRENGQTISVDGLVYNILHPTPLVAPRRLEDLE